MKKFPDDPSIKGGWFSMEDTTCDVICECGFKHNEPNSALHGLWVDDNEIVRCPKCGRGYKTEFVVWQFEPGEEDVRDG